MGCQCTFNTPITIPTALTGPTGSTGADGVDGVSIIVNGSGASSSTGNQTLVSGILPQDTVAAGDMLQYEAYLKFTTSYIGTVYMKLGSETILTHSIGANDIYTPPVGETDFVLLLKATVRFTTTSAEVYSSSIEAVEDTVSKVVNPITNATEDSSSDINLILGCNPSAGTATCSYFTVAKLKAQPNT